MADKRKLVRFSYTTATLENARYHETQQPSKIHVMEDKILVANHEPSSIVFCVFDGHDGTNAVDYVAEKFKRTFSSKSWQTLVSTAKLKAEDSIKVALKELFVETDKAYFEERKEHITERQRLQRTLEGLKSYDALQLYPREVYQLQTLDTVIQGGSTAATVAMCEGILYVSNIGDSRVLLYTHSGDCVQLSIDHNTENEQELARLSALGLNPTLLRKNGRIGSHENTRSFGDYNLKAGYRDVDILRAARCHVGTAEPHIRSARYDQSWKYIVVMTDGIYKALENMHRTNQATEVHRILFQCIESAKSRSNGCIAEDVVRNIALRHWEFYLNKIHSTVAEERMAAASCSKRDDMSIIVVEVQPL